MFRKVHESSKSLVNNFMYSFSIAWKASRPCVLARLVLEIIESFQPLVQLYMGKLIIDLIVRAVQSGKAPEIFPSIVFMIGLLTAVNVFVSVIRKVKELAIGIHQDLISNHINQAVMLKASELDISFFDSPDFYNELLNAYRDKRAIESMSWFVFSFVRSFIQLIAVIVVLSTLNPLLTLLFICLGIPAIVIEKRFTAFSYNWNRGQAPEERKMSYIERVMTDRAFSKDTRIFDLAPSLLSGYRDLWTRWFGGKKKILLRRGAWSGVSALLPIAGFLSVNLFVVYRILDGFSTVGDFALYTGAADQLLTGLYMLIHSAAEISDNQLRITYCRNFLAKKSRLEYSGSIRCAGNFDMEFKNVSFAYPGTSRKILDNCSFVIGEREKVAFVGANGAGKSTIVKLMLRFYDPDEGVVLLGGRDIREYDIKAFRTFFGVGFQDYTNYAFTLGENIAFFTKTENPRYMEDLKDAGKKSGVDRVAGRFPGGFDTYLTKLFDEHGEELSGGEWQKIAMARAFYRKAPVMILDEPTSSLDPEAECEVYRQFAKLSEGKTTILITHRLSNVRMTDSILVLEEGKIKERGPHGDLLAARGHYAYLFNLQADLYAAKR
jgi:ATP-binding cassette subfamily B protein